MEQSLLPIGDQFQSAVGKQIKVNRAKLLSILKTVVLCGKQNIPLRDDPRYLSSDSSHKCGNFQALLDFTIDAGDNVLKQHFETAPQNATYRSKTIQNELIDCVGAWIRQQLIREVAEACFFSILADETTDCSNREQLTLVFRFVDGENQIREDFYYIEASSTTGEAVADLLLTQVRMYGLDPSMIHGQGYDGAANMCGKQRGAATCKANNSPWHYMYTAVHMY